MQSKVQIVEAYGNAYMAGCGLEGDGVMSYILDALKKLEHEKNKKSRGNGMINISGVLFESEHIKPSNSNGLKFVLITVITVLLTISVTWFFLKSGKHPENNVPQPIVAVSPATKISPVKNELTVVLPTQSTSDTRLVRPNANPVSAKVTVHTPSAQSPKPKSVVVQSAVATEDAAALLTMIELRKRTKERKGQQVLSTGQVIAAPSDIKLSGIAWQDERRARRAVVNGFLMQEGGVISGARITDIYQDRVKFSMYDKVFEIPLVSSGISSAR